MALYIVDSTLDIVDSSDGVMTLREAIIEANKSSGTDWIRFDSSLSNQTIELDSDLPEITDSLNIRGRSGLSIDANGYKVFNFNADNSSLSVSKLSIQNADEAIGVYGQDNNVRISQVDVDDSEEAVSVNGSGHSVTVARSNIDGTTSGADGAIDINADDTTLNLRHSEIDGENVSQSEAIEVDGDFVTVNIHGSTIKNSGVGGREGAIDSDNGHDLTLNIHGSEILNNGDTGITIDAERADVNIFNTRFEGQDIGLEVDANNVDLDIYYSQFIENGDGIQVDGNNGPAQDLNAFVHRTEFSDNTGDGIDNNGEASDFTVSNSEFSGNGDRDLEGPDGYNIIGGLGGDVLGGSEGDDTFTGSWGRDTFEFRSTKGGDIFGDDFITDFSGDRLRIQVDNLDANDVVIAERDMDLLTIFVDEDGDLGTDDRLFQGNIQFASEFVVENLDEDDFTSDSDVDVFV